jgi:hypothetical protein
MEGWAATSAKSYQSRPAQGLTSNERLQCCGATEPSFHRVLWCNAKIQATADTYASPGRVARLGRSSSPHASGRPRSSIGDICCPQAPPWARYWPGAPIPAMSIPNAPGAIAPTSGERPGDGATPTDPSDPLWIFFQIFFQIFCPANGGRCVRFRFRFWACRIGNAGGVVSERCRRT